jgi:hypothetical protein
VSHQAEHARMKLLDHLRATVGDGVGFQTRESPWRRFVFFTKRGEVPKSTLDSWQRRGWVEMTSSMALPGTERIRDFELTEEGAAELLLEDSQGSEAPQQSAGQSQRSHEPPEHPEPHDTPR